MKHECAHSCFISVLAILTLTVLLANDEVSLWGFSGALRSLFK